ncbi:MAG: DUF3142 domain-containing protein [Verrucomicrobia bacterium]|nr:DUF3142 domain-containing protein [Verrucomicrobiota bacterium]
MPTEDQEEKRALTPGGNRKKRILAINVLIRRKKADLAHDPPDEHLHWSDDSQMPRRNSIAVLFACALLASCRPQSSDKPLFQRGYLWQRDWTPAVAAAVTDADRQMDGVVALGTEIQWNSVKPYPVRANLSWETLKRLKKAVALALRIDPYSGPFAEHDLAASTIVNEATRLIQEAQAHQLELSELQLDFDCPQKKLEGYKIWVHLVRAAIRPLKLVLTTLPTWLDEPDFPDLIGQSDEYVLQVHSIPTGHQTGREVLCDPARARTWVIKAGRLGRPFEVALPTYRCTAGYDPFGKLLGVAMDGVAPLFPPGTRLLEFDSDADALARLVNDWRAARPEQLKGLIWYRLPVSTDRQNWCWPTMIAVTEGRIPVHRLEVSRQGDNPVDLSMANNGEADVPVNCTVTVTWKKGILIASDALPGWKLRAAPGRVFFSWNSSHGLRLPPGSKIDIGWLRYDRNLPLTLQVSESWPAIQ